MPNEAPNEAPAGYVSSPFKLIGPSYNGIRRNVWTLVWLSLIYITALAVFVTLLVVCLLTALPGSLAGGWTYHSPAVGIAGIIVLAAAGAALSVYFMPVIYRFNLACARLQHMTFKQAIRGSWSLGWRLAYTNFLASLIISIGIILGIVPGIVFLVWYGLAGYVVVNENISGLKALERSKQLAANRFWDVLGTFSLPVALGVVSAIPLIGPLVRIVLSFILMPVSAVRYLMLGELKERSTGKNLRTSGWAYAFVALAVLFYIVSAASIINQAQRMTGVVNNGVSY